MYNLDDDVALKFYQLQKIGEKSITLTSGEASPVSGPTSVGTGAAGGPVIELSALIDILNEKFGTEFKPGDQLFFDSIKEDAVSTANLKQAAIVNTLDGFSYVFRKALEDLFIDRMEQNEDITAKFLNEPKFREEVSKYLEKEVYKQIRDTGGDQTHQPQSVS